MLRTLVRAAAGVGTTALACATPAHAQDISREAALETRLAALETALAGVRTELAAAREKAAARPAAKPMPVAAAAGDGFQVGGTTVKIGGFFKTYAAFSHYDGGDITGNTSGRDFYVPGAIPVGGPSYGESFEGNVKQTRLVVSTATPIGSHMLKSWLEMDFQVSPGAGNQRMTNAYNPGLRRAYISFDDITIGQDWTNFQYVAALPETTDYVGPSEGTVFARQVQLRYALHLGRSATLSLAAENPATTTAAAGSATIIEDSNDRLPDFTARLNWSGPFGELSLAGIARELVVDNGGPADSAFAWGISAAGKIPFGAGKRHDLRFMATYGSGIGRYVGLNFAPDAMLASAGTVRLDPVRVAAGFAALRLQWTAKLRSTVMGSYQHVSYPRGLAVAGANSLGWSAAANLFYSPFKPIDLGIEFRHGKRRVVSGASGALDRIEFAAKYNF